MPPSDSEFAYYADQISKIVGYNRSVILTFVLISFALVVVGGFSVYLLYASLGSYRSRLRTFPATSLVGRAQTASDDNPAPDSNDVDEERDAAVADDEYKAMTKILTQLRLSAESQNNDAIKKSRDEDVIDEKIFIKDHDDYVYPLRDDDAC